MYHHHPHHPGPHHPGPPHHSGIVGVFGGAVNLATSVLYGSAGLLRNVVEGTMWHGCHPHFDHGCHRGCDPCHSYDCCSCFCAPAVHHCCVQHVPPLYTGCC